ncbi:MAG: tetratricopeptide repeat protein [Planctomycetaceae bacterium]|nr:tetratricopeptide repeat protein [Planctomycetaceae bacterium]
MLPRIRIIAVFACIGIVIGIAPQVVRADSTNWGQEFLSMFRSNKSPAAQSEGATYTARTATPANTAKTTSAVSYHRLARMYADQNDKSNANTNFSLALQNASQHQVAGIAVDYAAFLTDCGDLRRAELMLRQALLQSPDNTEITGMLARCLIRQDKVTEGRRYFLSIGTEATANAEIAAIYREQGNTGMLVAVEQKWGSAHPEATRPAMVRPEAVQPVQPAPVLVAAASPRLAAAQPLPNIAIEQAVRTFPQPPLTTAVAPRTDVAREVASFVPPPAPAPVSKSEFFDNRVPIPVPKVAPLPATVATDSPSPAPAPALFALTPMPTQPAPAKLALTNPVRLVAAPVPAPVVPAAETKGPPQPATTIQPRRHYVVNAGTSTEFETLPPGVRSVAATVER